MQATQHDKIPTPARRIYAMDCLLTGASLLTAAAGSAAALVLITRWEYLFLNTLWLLLELALILMLPKFFEHHRVLRTGLFLAAMLLPILVRVYAMSV